MKSIQKLANILIVVFMATFIGRGTEIEGVVRLTGTSLFPSIIITTEQGTKYYVDKALYDQFVEHQHRTVIINATKIEDIESQLADGSKTFIRPTIFEAEILEVK